LSEKKNKNDNKNHASVKKDEKKKKEQQAKPENVDSYRPSGKEVQKLKEKQQITRKGKMVATSNASDICVCGFTYGDPEDPHSADEWLC